MKAAIYARFSTDKQSESSIEDQYRVCRDYAELQELQTGACFEDQGISGAAIGNRPGFLEMMDAARNGDFDVLVVMDLSRLSRSQSDLPKTIDRLTHRGVRVIGVQDGFDSSRKGYKLQAGLSGIMGEAFREMVAERTYSALQSRAIRGDKTGGRAYGYRAGEAAIVQQVFEWYASGRSARWIACELNRQGIPAPGASWNRTRRRRGGWHPAAISGDRKRGIGILNNEAYVGRVVWNRSRWMKDPDTGKRRSVLRPKSEWIVHDVPELRLVSAAIWGRVKTRQDRRSMEVGDRIRSGKRSPGRAARYLFSTLIKCAVCGSNYVMADASKYACSGYVNGHVCSNSVRVRRDVLEDTLLKAIKTELLTDSAVTEFRRRVVKALRRPDPYAARRRKLESEITQLTDAIAAGLISPAVVGRLKVVESDVAAIPPAKVADMDAALTALPRAVERYREMVADLGNTVLADIERAREVLREMVGEIRVTPENGHLIYEMGLNETPLTALAGGASQIGVVAGAGFEPATFGL